jgi:hypothetical protein
MALQRTHRPRFRSGRSLRSLGSPLNAYPFGGTHDHQIARPAFVASLAIAFVGSTQTSCASLRVTRNERVAIVRAGLSVVERGMPGLFVIPDRADRATRDVLCELRRCIARASVRSSDLHLVPRGYFVFEELQITGNDALFSGTVGPIERPVPGRLLNDCGTGFAVPLHRDASGQWVAGRYSVTVC